MRILAIIMIAALLVPIAFAITENQQQLLDRLAQDAKGDPDKTERLNVILHETQPGYGVFVNPAYIIAVIAVLASAAVVYFKKDVILLRMRSGKKKDVEAMVKKYMAKHKNMGESPSKMSADLRSAGVPERLIKKHLR